MALNKIDALKELLAKVEAGETTRLVVEALALAAFDLPDDVDWQISRDTGGAYHGSLDAAKALHDAVLPGWLWTNGSVPETEFGQGNLRLCLVWPDEPYHHLTKFRPEGKNADPARAWLIAILKALIAKEKGE